MKRIALFVSGSGTNAENIIKFFADSPIATVDVLLSNRADAYAITRAKNMGVDAIIFSKNDFYESEIVMNILEHRKIDYVVLAGFLWLVPKSLTQKYHDRVLNIHPALLPKFGGKGMYGDNVHKAVLEAGEKFSGITIHKVNAEYDSGDIVFQAKTEIEPSDDFHDLAAKIHLLEQKYFPTIIEQEIKKI